MRRTFELTAFLLALTFSAVAQPSIKKISNAASFVAAPLDDAKNPIGNNNIAQGSFFVIEGSGLGPGTIVVAATLPLGIRIPETNGTTVSISNGAQSVQAYMYYSQDGYVCGILPSNMPVGPASVTVTYNAQTSKAYSINVVKTQLGIFTRNSQGNGAASGLLFVSASSTPYLSLTTPAHPGSTIILFGTGLGPIGGPDNVAPGAVTVGSNVTVNIAGIVVPAAYAGRQPQYPGEDQFNVTLPANVPTGCYVPAEITANGRPSNLFYLSIAPAGQSACTHPLGLPASALAKLDAGATVNTGLFLMSRAFTQGLSLSGAGGLFENTNENAAFQLYRQILFAFGGYNFPVATGSCAVLDTLDPPASPDFPTVMDLGGSELRTADFLNLTGPVNSAVITRQTPDTGGYLTLVFAPFEKGTWTLSAPAGADVAAFSGKTDLPEPLVWSNVGNFGTPPRSDLTITWTGGTLSSGQGVVTISGTSVVINPTDPSKSRGAVFLCNAPASAGRFTVPASVVQQLPSSSGTAAGEVASGQLGIYAGGGSTFQAALSNGTPFDSAYLAYGEAHLMTVRFQ